MGSCRKKLNARIRCSTGIALKNFNKQKLFVHFYRNLIYQYKRPRFRVGENVRISKKVIPLRKRFKSQIANEFLKIVKIATYNQPTYNPCGEQIDKILGEFYEQ